MQRMIGKFMAYTPDRDLFQDMLSILSHTVSEKNETINFPINKLHSFFFERKKENPDFFKDVYFNDNPEFPYSREIADVFIRLQETEFLTRPNPSLNRYKLAADICKVDNVSTESELIRHIGRQFKNEFQRENECDCTCR